MKLYEIAQNYRAFVGAVENGEINDIEAIENTLDAITDSFEVKADNIAGLVKTWEAEAAAIKAEADALMARAKAKTAHVENMKRYLTTHMLQMGMKKLETPRNLVTFKKSEKVEIDTDIFMAWAKDWRDDLLRYKAPEPDKTAIKAAIKDGCEVVGAQLVENQNIQIK